MSDVAILNQPGIPPEPAVERGSPIHCRRRRFRRRRPYYVWLALAGGVGLLFLRLWQESSQTVPPETLDEGPHEVAEVLTGDTLRLTNHAIVRLNGVDAPDLSRSGGASEPWAAEAADFIRRFVSLQPVRLTFDRERVNRQGQFSAYIYAGDRFLNEELLRAGLARARPRPGDSAAKKRLLEKAERAARQARRGLWSRPAGDD